MYRSRLQHMKLFYVSGTSSIIFINYYNFKKLRQAICRSTLYSITLIPGSPFPLERRLACLREAESYLQDTIINNFRLRLGKGRGMCLFHKNHFFSLSKVVRFDTVQVNSASETCSIEINLICTGLLNLINQGSNLLPEDVKYL